VTDIATLGFAVDTGGLVKGETRLNELTGAAKRAEAAAQGVAASVNNAGAASARAAAGVQAQATAMNTLATSAKMAAFQQRNLVFQLNDVAVSLASGMNPLMVAAQQGSQIATIYSAQEGGVARAFQETGKMALAAASGLGRFILAHPIATAGVLALGGALQGIVGDLRDAGHESIGYGDVFVAAMQVAASGIYNVFKPAIDFLGPYVGAAWDWIAAKTKWLANGIVNTFSAGIKIVGTVFGNLPTIAGAAAIGAANAVIAAIEAMINGASSLLNSFSNEVNLMLLTVQSATGVNLGTMPTIGKVAFGRLENPYAGQAAKVASDLANSLGDTFNQDPVGEFAAAVKAQSIANDEAERKAKGKKGGKGRGGRAERTARDEEAEALKRQAKAYDDLVKSQQRAIDMTKLETDSLHLSEEARRAVMLAQDLLNRAQDAGVKLTQDQTKELQNLAKETAAAEAALDQRRKKIQDEKDAMEFLRDVSKGFLTDLRAGLVAGGNAWDAFANAAVKALNRILDRMADEMFEKLLDGIFGPGPGGPARSPVSDLVSSIFQSFDSGGYTGNAPRTAVAGVVHGGEYVVNAQNTARFRPQLEQMNRGQNPWADQGRAPMGGNIMVSGEFKVVNGNIVPTIAAVSGQIAGQQVRQANRGFQGRANEINARGV
jgi:hypothetical protein